MLRVTYDIVRREGPLMLWTGVGPAITRHYIYTGIRIGFYEWLRDLGHDKKVISNHMVEDMERKPAGLSNEILL